MVYIISIYQEGVVYRSNNSWDLMGFSTINFHKPGKSVQKPLSSKSIQIADGVPFISQFIISNH